MRALPYFPIPRAHAAHRSWSSTLGGVAVLSLFPALMFVPGVPLLLSIDRAGAPKPSLDHSHKLIPLSVRRPPAKACDENPLTGVQITR